MQDDTLETPLERFLNSLFNQITKDVEPQKLSKLCDVMTREHTDEGRATIARFLQRIQNPQTLSKLVEMNALGVMAHWLSDKRMSIPGLEAVVTAICHLPVTAPTWAAAKLPTILKQLLNEHDEEPTLNAVLARALGMWHRAKLPKSSEARGFTERDKVEKEVQEVGGDEDATITVVETAEERPSTPTTPGLKPVLKKKGSAPRRLSVTWKPDHELVKTEYIYPWSGPPSPPLQASPPPGFASGFEPTVAWFPPPGRALRARFSSLGSAHCFGTCRDPCPFSGLSAPLCVIRWLVAPSSLSRPFLLSVFSRVVKPRVRLWWVGGGKAGVLSTHSTEPALAHNRPIFVPAAGAGGLKGTRAFLRENSRKPKRRDFALLSLYLPRAREMNEREPKSGHFCLMR